MSLSFLLRGSKLIASHVKCSSPASAILCNTNLGQLGQRTDSNQIHHQFTSLQQVKNFSVSPKRASSHDHGKLWGAERLVSVSLLGTVPLALLYPSQALDSVVALSMVMHSHWGLEACVIDYVRPIIFGPAIPKIALGALYLASIATLAGLFFLIFNDMGLANAILKFWKL